MIGQLGEQLRSIRPKSNTVRVSNRVAVITVAHQKRAVVAHVGPTGPGASIGQCALAGKRIAAQQDAGSISHHQRTMQRRKGPLLCQRGCRRPSESGSAAQERSAAVLRVTQPNAKPSIEIAQHEVLRAGDDRHQMFSRADHRRRQRRFCIAFSHSQTNAHGVLGQTCAQTRPSLPQPRGSRRANWFR